MKLEEQYKKATSQWFDTTECEQIADEFAVDFAKWYCCKRLLSTYSPTKKTEDPLEIYKKEKGL